jgi:hypothetical protein
MLGHGEAHNEAQLRFVEKVVVPASVDSEIAQVRELQQIEDSRQAWGAELVAMGMSHSAAVLCVIAR